MWPNSTKFVGVNEQTELINNNTLLLLNEVFDLYEKKKNNTHSRSTFTLFKVNNGNTRLIYEICSKLIVKTPEWRQWIGTDFRHYSAVSTVSTFILWTSICQLGYKYFTRLNDYLQHHKMNCKDVGGYGWFSCSNAIKYLICYLLVNLNDDSDNNKY